MDSVTKLFFNSISAFDNLLWKIIVTELKNILLSKEYKNYTQSKSYITLGPKKLK